MSDYKKFGLLFIINLSLYKDMSGKLWLHYAQRGNLEKMKLMRKNLKYLDLNCVTELHQSGLMLAIKGNHNKVIDYLLKKNCDIDIEDKLGENALSLAIRHKNQKLMRILYEKGSRLSQNLKEIDKAMQKSLFLLENLES